VTDLKEWIGRATELDCWIDPWRAQALHATLDAADAVPAGGAVLAPGWHWAYFLDTAPSKELGPDGHPRRGGFMPPVPLPRRMWAGSRLEFLAPLSLGESAKRVSRILSVEEKSGRSGRLCFVAVEHEIHGASGVAIREQQDIVYRDVATGGAPPVQPAPNDAQWTREWVFDAPRLFRYSAITFNSHRIHYDREYVTTEEGYPGLVVHGPLLATLMLELVRERQPGHAVRRFEFRAIAPVFDAQRIEACGKPDGDRIDVWIRGASGSLHMRGNVVLG
jgi:3-methylfumaryl-CoA hydratase